MFAHLPSLNGIRVFEAAARHLSFKLAAQELSLTPTAVSHQIRNLESLLKVTLFTRHTRAVTLTDAGQSLYATSHQLLRQLDHSIAELTTQVQLTLSAPSALASLWLLPALTEFATQWPEINIQVVQGDALADSHFCISRPPVNHQNHADIHHHTLLTLPELFGVYASPAYLQRRHENHSLLQLSRAKTAMAAIPGWDTWAQQYGSFREAKMVEFEREEALLQACLAGQGLALISSLLASDAAARGWLNPCLADKVIPGPGYMLSHGSKVIAAKTAQPFMAWLSARVSQAQLR